MITQFPISSLLIGVLLLTMVFSCKKDSDNQSPSGDNLPQFNNPTGTPVSDVTANSARFAVTITDDGGSAITARGVVWNTSTEPKVALSTKTSDGTGKGIFTSTLSSLAANTKYYARAYATNANGTAYGSEINFTTEKEAANLPVFNNPASSPITDITATSAKFLVNISSDGGFAITARGVCWSTSAGPTASLSTKTSEGTGIGSFTSSLSGLVANTKYFARAYATNANGTSFGKEWEFTTSTSGGNTVTVTDVDGNTYATVKIGTQTWMKENLKTSKYRDGSAIPTRLSDTLWWTATTGAYAIYNNDTANNTTYGKLYNFYAVADPRGLCPSGWHMPSNSEWDALEVFLGMPLNELNYTGGGRGQSQNVGGKLKAVSNLWTSPNSGATDLSGFSGLPGGGRIMYGGYFNIGKFGGWWSSRGEETPTDAWARSLGYQYGDAFRSSADKRTGNSVRCIKD